jgi:hypothetical protein
MTVVGLRQLAELFDIEDTDKLHSKCLIGSRCAKRRQTPPLFSD